MPREPTVLAEAAGLLGISDQDVIVNISDQPLFPAEIVEQVARR